MIHEDLEKMAKLPVEQQVEHLRREAIFLREWVLMQGRVNLVLSIATVLLVILISILFTTKASAQFRNPISAKDCNCYEYDRNYLLCSRVLRPDETIVDSRGGIVPHKIESASHACPFDENKTPYSGGRGRYSLHFDAEKTATAKLWFFLKKEKRA
jgi:hypothetical protein